jgi:hypothetical protein
MSFAHLQNIGICNRRLSIPFCKKEELQSLLVPFAQPTGSCAPATSRRSLVPMRSVVEAALAARTGGEGEGRRRAEALLAGEEGGTAREGRPYLVVPAPGGLLVVPAATALLVVFAPARMGPAMTVCVSEDGKSGPLRRRGLLPTAPHLFPATTCPLAWICAGGAGLWGRVAETVGAASTRPPARICRGQRLLAACSSHREGVRR